MTYVNNKTALYYLHNEYIKCKTNIVIVKLGAYGKFYSEK